MRCSVDSLNYAILSQIVQDDLWNQLSYSAYIKKTVWPCVLYYILPCCKCIKIEK